MWTIKQRALSWLAKLPQSNSKYSLRQRMLTRTALLMCAVLAILSVGVWHYANTSADYSYDRLLSSASVSMLDGISVSGEQINIDLPYSAFEILQLAPDDKVFYGIYGPKGRLLSGYNDLPVSNDDIVSATQQPYYSLRHYRQQKVRFIVRSKRLSERSVAGDVTIVLGQTTQARDSQMRDTLYTALTTLMAVMAIALLVMWIAINRALAPLNWLSDQLQPDSAMQDNSLPDTRILEVAPLTHAINNYRHQWLDALGSMRDFIADASHQIRTAQATTKAQLEIALSAKANTIDKASVEAIYQDHTKLTRLTNQLLAHATVLHRGDRKAFFAIDLNQMLKEVITHAVRDYAHTDVEFEYLGPEHPLSMYGDEIVLKEALRNIIDNAVIHGQSDQPDHLNLIRISIKQGDHSYEICIEDSGFGIPEHARAQALERFAKVGPNQHGSGLGLAIAHSAALTHEGQLTLGTSSLGGLQVSLRLPNQSESVTHYVEQDHV
ncbi:sensor histidine kinase [Marinomonas ostreistagni]|uniref:sensor histidine kinase n=1 Tax=Marinomonas ostreistagni TaxID=359209 RepID=UPI00194E1982|nr:sensor histidine kinase [Marinomonas ostreistagni]MBM6549786.1 sensor histidine kinase [Marinomonas ostreistagni]